MDLLIVDTRDASRAPMLGALMARHAARQARPLRVRTAGTRAGSGSVHVGAVDAVGERGIDLTSHVPTLLHPAMLEADLILAVTREHVRSVLSADRTTWPRLFTPRELVRRGTGVGGRRLDEPLGDWLERVGDGRSTTDHVGASALDDMADLRQGDSGAHAQEARELEGVVRRLLDLLWPRRP